MDYSFDLPKTHGTPVKHLEFNKAQLPEPQMRLISILQKTGLRPSSLPIAFALTKDKLPPKLKDFHERASRIVARCILQ